MTAEDNKAMVVRFIEEVYNKSNTDALAEFCVPGSFLAGGLAGQVKNMKATFPDLVITIDEMLAEGDKVAVQLTMRGTNSGPLLGFPAFGKLEQPVPPTGKAVTSSSVYIFTLKDGRVLSLSAVDDQLSVLLQMGWTISPPGQE